jgi:hypothetical protein
MYLDLNYVIGKLVDYCCEEVRILNLDLDCAN